jgi:uncharacterized membrane protein YdjX (TVP38/TMEM64 family)
MIWKSAGVALVVAGVAAAAYYLPLRDWVVALSDWARSHGYMGMLLFGAVYVAGTILCLWGALFTIACGIAFGLFWGTVVAWLSATTGAAIAFLVGRYVARDAVEKWAARHHKFRAIDHAIGEHGWKVVALLRLNPLIPFNLSNYAYGLTKVRFWPYVFASMGAMLPGTFLYVYLGHVGKVTLTRDTQPAGSTEYGIMAAGLLVTVAITVYLTRLAKKALARAEAHPAVTGGTAEQDAGEPK